MSPDWDENSPASLLDLGSTACIAEPRSFCTVEETDGGKPISLLPDLSLPAEICEKLLQSAKEKAQPLTDSDVKIFEDTRRTKLRKADVSNSFLTDDGLAILLKHPLTQLDISDCSKLSETTLMHLNDHAGSLLSLNIGTSIQILPDTLAFEGAVYKTRGHILNLKNLRRLIIWDMFVGGENDYFPLLLEPLKSLTHLDLSGCGPLGDLKILVPHTYLVSLVLYNVKNLQDGVLNICQLKELRLLDLSQSEYKYGKYTNPNHVLATLVKNLPYLTSLDISGTNLAGSGVAEPGLSDQSIVVASNSVAGNASPSSFSYQRSISSSSETGEMLFSDIAGLSSRVSTPLEFLGLYNTVHDACHRHHIPALKVSGSASEEQILTAVARYLDRPEIMQKVLNDLYHLLRYDTCSDPRQAVYLVIQAMERHIAQKHIQVSGSASLFYIVKSKDHESHHSVLNRVARRKVISVLLNAMTHHKDDSTMLRNGCLILCQFKILQDLLFDYERLIKILLYAVSESNSEEFVQRVAIYILNSFACQVDSSLKKLVGHLGAIEKMLALIQDRLSRRHCDEVMEIAWSTMWNITDETTSNCQMFLDNHGMELFLRCMQTFPDKGELLRNMMGLLGNVSEVPHLRPRLMTTEFITVFSLLLESNSDGIEVSYNAAGVLSHICSDGTWAWTIESPQRDDVLQRMGKAIDSWDITAKRNINYRSFEPILRLLKVDHTPICQYWAVWALANLTHVYPGKYCRLLEAEGGLELLLTLYQNPKTLPKTRVLAKMVVDHCVDHRKVSKDLTEGEEEDDHNQMDVE